MMLRGRICTSLVSLLHFNPPHALRQPVRFKRHKAWEVQMDGFTGGPVPIVKAGTVVLRQPAAEVPLSMLGTSELRSLVDTMLETMRSAPGVGLAAPQIGVGLAIIVLEDRPEYISLLKPELAAAQRREPFEAMVLVNPRLRAVGGEGARFFEGCLSVPGYQALVERYAEVEVEAMTPEGEPVRLRALGWKARILQHEVDHLRGQLYIDRMISRSFGARGNGREGLPDDVPPLGPCSCCHVVDPQAI